MNEYPVDLHIHTCLSPCGSLAMSPSAIIQGALAKGLSAIAITDHNTTLQCPEIQAPGREAGLTVFAGAEVTTREEAHCIVLFPSEEVRLRFQSYLEEHLPAVPNNPEYFGDQVWVNRREEVLGEYPRLLISALRQSIDQVAACARRMGCLFVPAHVERPANSVIGQLGFLDPRLPVDAIEYHDPQQFEKLRKAHPCLDKYTCYTASDAHFPDQIGTPCALLNAPSLTFANLARAFHKEEGCSISSFF
ncbi:MAG: PHP domain-containing protein [Tannerellaceae bacterium]|jgi:PHP family Zn ribbon phosphoesterase|nr:PHP domain-containing protein [Tannerellaceae bacterium]